MKIKDWSIRTTLVIITCGFATALLAQSLPTSPESRRDADLYTAPKIENFSELQFFRANGDKPPESVVTAQLMVDRRGRPEEIQLIARSGNAATDLAAIDAIVDMQFAPATLNGQRVSAGVLVPVFFVSPEVDVVGRKFEQTISKLNKALERGNKSAADTLLAGLDPQSQLEVALKYLAKYAYAQKWGTEAEQIAHLRRAIAGATEPKYLGPDSFVNTLEALFQLEVKTQDYGAALATWKTLKAQSDPQRLVGLQQVADRVETLRSEPRHFAFSGSAPEGTWHYRLFRNKFRINVKSGRISQIKLYCENKFDQFGFDPKMEYTVDPKYGSCSMVVYADPNSKFDLIQ
jgi:TonB family protein